MKKLKLLATFAIASVMLIAGCKQDDYKEAVGVCPLVVSTVPIDKAINVPLNQVVTATFNEKMNPATITQESFTLQQGTTAITGAVSYSGITASFLPDVPLSPFTVYTGRVTTKAKDPMGNALQTDHVWTFTTIPLLTLSSLPLIGGTTSGAGTFDQGSTVTAAATPNPSYSFTNWTENGAIVSTNSNYPFTMAGNRTLVANFTLQYTVNLSANPVLGGITVGAGVFNAGTSVTVTATPNAEFNFVNWTQSGTIVSTDLSYVFPLNENKTFVANYILKTYTLNVNATNGTTVKNPNQLTYNSGALVQLTATPATGYTFTGWSGDATGSISPLTVTMNANKVITANFTLNTYTLIVNATNGTVVKNPVLVNYNSGSTVQLTATPNAGYTFTSWSGDATGNTNPLNVTMTANKNITANFTLNTYTLNVTAANGTVVKNPVLANYNSGSTVQLTATPNAGYTFTSWSGDATGTTNPLNVTMTANKNITANFTAIQYTVALSSNPLLGGTTSGSGSFNSGASVTVNAVPAVGYTFTNWTEGANIVSSNANYTFNIGGNKTFVAHFTSIILKYTVVLSSSPLLGGTTNGGGSFDSGASVTVSAVSAIGYTFTNWTQGANIVSSTSNYTFTINGNKTFVANFIPEVVGQFLVVLSSNPLLGGNTNGAGSFNSGASVTITALPNSGYTFTNWTEGANIISSNANYTFTIDANRNFVANFTADVIPPSGPLAIDLGCAAPFAILAGSTITSTGPSIITGNVGLSAGTALVGFPPGVINGTQEITTPIAAAAKICLTTAYNDGQGRSLNAISLPGQLGGLTLAPGLYSNSSTSGISGTGANGILTLDAQGNSSAVWIFQMGSTLTTDPATSIVLAGGAQASNIFWIVGTSATLGTTSVFYGNILADQSITLNTGAVLNGRALTRIAAVSLDASTVTKP